MRRLLLSSTIAVLLLAGCGGGSSTDIDQIKAAQRALLTAMQHDKVGDICRLAANQGDCLSTFATAHVLGVKPSDTLKGNEAERIRTMKVTVTGDHAVSDRGNRFVKRDGRWLVVMKKV